MLTPLTDALRDHVFAADVVHADDTPIPVLAPGHGKTKTGRLWTYVRDERAAAGEAAPAVWFTYTANRNGEHPQHHLRDFTGILQADGSRRASDAGKRQTAAKIDPLGVSFSAPKKGQFLSAVSNTLATLSQKSATAKAIGYALTR